MFRDLTRLISISLPAMAPNGPNTLKSAVMCLSNSEKEGPSSLVACKTARLRKKRFLGFKTLSAVSMQNLKLVGIVEEIKG